MEDTSEDVLFEAKLKEEFGKLEKDYDGLQLVLDKTKEVRMSSVEETKYRNIIAKHEQDIRRWRRMISDADAAIKYNKDKILKLQGREYYVYAVFVEDKLKYVGKGKRDRYKHAVTGVSSCPELNRDFFQEKCIEVRFLGQNLLEHEALSMEAEFLYSFSDQLYNKNIPTGISKQQVYWDCCDSIVYHKLSSHACANVEKDFLIVPKEVEWSYD